MQHINYCSHAEQLTFNCHKGVRGVGGCGENKKDGTLGWVNMGNDLTREHVFLSLPTTSWSYFYSPGFRRVTLL
jgi:hypothetical protein